MIQLFLEPDDISEIVGFDGNIDIDRIKPIIEVAQKINIKNLLGDDLYNVIYQGSLSGNYLKILNDYIRPILAWHTASIYLSLNTFKTANNGSFKLGGNTGDTSPTSLEIKEMASNYKNIAVSYEGQFLKFMATIEIPEFKNAKKTTDNLTNWY